MIQDYRLEFKVKNNKMLEIMENNGYFTAAELSRASGITYQAIAEMLNLKRPAYHKKGGFRSTVQQVADFLRCMPTDLFPQQHLDKALERNTANMKVNLTGLLEFQGQHDQKLIEAEHPEYKIEKQDLLRLLDSAIGDLNKREQAILRFHFIEGFTFAQIGKQMDISVERARQIEHKAIRKLQNSVKLRPVAKTIKLDGGL